MRYEVIAGNVGTIYLGDEPLVARRAYLDAVWLSTHEKGRMAGESVYLMKNGEPISEHEGTNDQDQ